MSNHIPFEIQEEIIKKLPVRSLVIFRFVSQQWKSLIDSSEFITDYHVRYTQQQYVLVTPGFSGDSHSPIKLEYYPRIIGSSKVLIAYYNYLHIVTAILWNPAVRNSFAIELSHAFKSYTKTVVGFGVCPNSNKRKIVKFIFSGKDDSLVCGTESVEVFVYTGNWKWNPHYLHDRTLIPYTCSHVLDGISYWLAFDGETYGHGSGWYDLIMSFDLTSEESRESYIQYAPDLDLFITKLRESKIVLNISESNSDGSNKQDYNVLMENYVPPSFAKLCTVQSPSTSIKMVSGFRMSGKNLDGMRNDREDDFYQYALSVTRHQLY